MTCRNWHSEDDFVILTATALFWLPELAGILLAGLVLLQRKIADSLLV